MSMSFFEPPPPPRTAAAPAAVDGPANAVVGPTLPLDLLIGRSEKAAIWMPAVTA